MYNKYRLVVVKDFCDYCCNKGQVYYTDKLGEGSWERCPKCHNKRIETVLMQELNQEEFEVIKSHIKYWEEMRKNMGISD